MRKIIEGFQNACLFAFILMLAWCVGLTAVSLKKIANELRLQNELNICFTALRLGVDTKSCDRLLEKK